MFFVWHITSRVANDRANPLSLDQNVHLRLTRLSLPVILGKRQSFHYTSWRDTCFPRPVTRGAFVPAINHDLHSFIIFAHEVSIVSSGLSHDHWAAWVVALPVSLVQWWVHLPVMLVGGPRELIVLSSLRHHD